jgi:trimethylamine:corrinoid methyltransferase-like protein
MRDVWIPALSHPRQPVDGGPLPDIRQRARAELDRILDNHRPEPLEEAAQAELKAILDAAAQENGL